MYGWMDGWMDKQKKREKIIDKIRKKSERNVRWLLLLLLNDGRDNYHSFIHSLYSWPLVMIMTIIHPSICFRPKHSKDNPMIYVCCMCVVCVYCVLFFSLFIPFSFVVPEFQCLVLWYQIFLNNIQQTYWYIYSILELPCRIRAFVDIFRCQKLVSTGFLLMDHHRFKCFVFFKQQQLLNNHFQVNFVCLFVT